MLDILLIGIGAICTTIAYVRYRRDDVGLMAFMNPLRPQDYYRPPGALIHAIGSVFVLLGLVVGIITRFL